MHLRYTLGLSEAVVGVAAGLATASKEGWAVTIAVVDDCGTPLHLSRVDGASAASVSTAIGKASTAAHIGLETKMLEDVIRQRPAVATLDRVAVEGGVPVLYKDQRVGGIGVSGVQSHQDAVVAKAALAAVLEYLAQHPSA